MLLFICWCGLTIDRLDPPALTGPDRNISVPVATLVNNATLCFAMPPHEGHPSEGVDAVAMALTAVRRNYDAPHFLFTFRAEQIVEKSRPGLIEREWHRGFQRRQALKRSKQLSQSRFFGDRGPAAVVAVGAACFLEFG